MTAHDARHAPAARVPVAPALRVLVAQTWGELVIRSRFPAFSVTSLALPVLLFTFFGLPLVGRRAAGDVDLGTLLLTSFAAYTVGQVMVFGFGIGVAIERGHRVDVLMRATPMSAAVYLGSKVVVGMVFALLALVVLFAYAAVVGGVRLAPGVLVGVVARLLVGALPLVALGFAIGYTAGPNAAPAVANLVYLPLAFASGIFLPLERCRRSCSAWR
ncbi:MAG TPA: ABC transporter permease, partial [Candidatus Tectomicrobia bacterium]|nr:ABC transporter permease [Candidatus Tectomicrobia bacterium]